MILLAATLIFWAFGDLHDNTFFHILLVLHRHTSFPHFISEQYPTHCHHQETAIRFLFDKL